MNDILLDTDLDIQVANGDLVAGMSDQQHQLLLLETSKGEWKQSPLTGVGIQLFLNDESPDELFKEIREQWAAERFELNDIYFENDKIVVK